MRALTLTQPWAGFVASGIKLVENRPRHMIKREDFGVPFALHASREIDEDVYKTIAEFAPELAPLDHRDCVFTPVFDTSSAWYRLSRITSAVIAVATIADVVNVSDCELSGDDERHARTRLREAGAEVDSQFRWLFGPIGYVLRDVRALATPVPCRGRQGFWTLPDEVAARVEEQIR